MSPNRPIVNSESTGARLRDERARLKLSQEEFAALGGVQRRAQMRYEKDERAPDAEYLLKLANRGVDIGYVLTGIRTVRWAGLASDEVDEVNELVGNYWNLDTNDRAQVRNIVGALVLKELQSKGHTRGIRKLTRGSEEAAHLNPRLMQTPPDESESEEGPPDDSGPSM